MHRDIVIIHYNTPELTEAVIRSIRKSSGMDWHITIFDNSDKRPFWRPMDGVRVIDNTKGQEIDFDSFLSCFPERGEQESSNWGSAKHCKSVDHCFDLFPDGFLLMDSDVIVTRDISELYDERVAWSGWVHCNTRHVGVERYRVCPFLCYLNVPMLREHGIRYFNPEKMWCLVSDKERRYYDTGAWLLEETRRLGLPVKETEVLGKYIEHFRGGSWRKSHYDAVAWLDKMSKYYIEKDMAKKTTPSAVKTRPAVKKEKKSAVSLSKASASEGIDIVVPMVFPNDNTWLAEYRACCAEAGRPVQIDERVRSWDLERYFFRGIEKFMPWIRKIHLILSDDSQVPYWLDTKKVHIVLHRDIMPSYQIPTFNSSSIEMWLHNIEGLSERFIYCNDDMIAVSPLSEQDFFIDGRPVTRCVERNEPVIGDFLCTVRNSLDLAAKDHGKTFDDNHLLRCSHSFAPMLLSVVKKVADKHVKEMHDSCTRFRSDKNMNQYLYTYEMWLDGKCVNGSHSHRYYNINSDYDRMREQVLSGTIGVACFNDGGIGDWREMRTALYKTLQIILGEKSSYEL